MLNHPQDQYTYSLDHQNDLRLSAENDRLVKIATKDNVVQSSKNTNKWFAALVNLSKIKIEVSLVLREPHPKLGR
jgi:hypothetical protein